MNAPYATVDEIKLGAPDTFQGTTNDVAVRFLSLRASLLIEKLARWTKFWPVSATRYFDGSGGVEQWIDDLLEITSVSISADYGATYAALGATDYQKLGGTDLRLDATPYSLLRMWRSGNYSQFYTGQNAVKIVGLWGWHDDYANAWEDSLDTVEDNPLSNSATTITVNDADGAVSWGLTPRFQIGQVIKCESEQMIVTDRDTTLNKLTVVRAQHGTTAASHAQNTPLYIYRPPEVVKQAVIIQTARWFKRGQSAFQDVTASAEMGTLVYAKSLDPEIETIIKALGTKKTSF